MTNIYNIIVTHWVDILACFGGLVAAASAFVKLTPTQKDDNFVALLVKILNWLSIFNPKKDQEVLDKAEAKKK